MASLRLLRHARTACTPSVGLSVRRASNVAPDAAALTKLPNIDASKLEITKTTKPKELLPAEQLIFGRNFTG